MKRLAFFLAIAVAAFSCSKEEELSPTDSFFKIYDDSNADLSYEPIDIVETVDGYIVLTGTTLNSTDFKGVQLLKIDLEGEYVGDTELANYVIPVGDLFLIDSISYFFAANPTTLGATLIGVNPQLEVVTEAPLGGLNYPLAAGITSTPGQDLLLLSYDPVDLESQISQITTQGNIVGSDSYSIGPGDDVLEDIINHYLGTGDRPLPFFCGEYAPGNYYFNSFYNFNFSLVFTNLSGVLGEYLGLQTQAAIRSLLPLGGTNFAVAGYQFTDNYQLANQALTIAPNQNVSDLYTGDLADLKSYTPSKIISYTLGEGGETYTVFAAETEGRQINLRFYNGTTGEIAAVYPVGFLNPFTFSSLKVTSDNSILVMGTSFVAGRFKRVTLTKISQKELGDIVN